MTARVARSGPPGSRQQPRKVSPQTLAAFLFSAAGPLLQQTARVQSHRVECLGAEPILLEFRLSDKISHRRSAQTIQEPENRAFLNDGRSASSDDALLARRIEKRQTEDRALSLKRPTKRPQ